MEGSSERGRGRERSRKGERAVESRGRWPPLETHTQQTLSALPQPDVLVLLHIFIYIPAAAIWTTSGILNVSSLDQATHSDERIFGSHPQAADQCSQLQPIGAAEPRLLCCNLKPLGILYLPPFADNQH